VDVEGAVHRDDCGTGSGTGTLVLVNVLGGEIIVVAIGEEDGFFTFHRDFEQSAERDHAFVDAMPMPGNDAAGGEFDLDDGRTFVGITTENSEGDAVRRAMRRAIFLRRGFADDGGVWRFLCGCGQSREKQCGEKNCFHGWLRLVSGYVSRFEGRVSTEIAGMRRSQSDDS